MPDITVKRLDEMARGSGGAFGSAFALARASLGVSSFGLQVLDMPAGFEGPPHAHEGMTGRLAAVANDGQEEVYVALEGRALLLVAGQEIALEPGVMVRCGPGVMRQIVTRASAARVLAIGAAPGGGYTAPGFTELPA